MDKLYIGLEADRLAVAAILIKNKYTVRRGFEKRGTGKSYNGSGQAKPATEKGAAQDDS